MGRLNTPRESRLFKFSEDEVLTPSQGYLAAATTLTVTLNWLFSSVHLIASPHVVRFALRTTTPTLVATKTHSWVPQPAPITRQLGDLGDGSGVPRVGVREPSSCNGPFRFGGVIIQYFE